MKKTLKQTSTVEGRYLRWLLNGMESLDQGFCLFDRRLELVYCNGRYLELLGLPQQYGESGTPLRSIIQYQAECGEYGPGDRNEQIEIRIRRAERFEAHCFTHERTSGKVIEVRGAPLSGGGFVSTFTDVTSSVQAQKAAAASEEQLARIVQGCAIPIFVLDSEHRVSHWNHACELATGLSANMMIGRRECWRAFYQQPRPVLADLVLSQVSEPEIFRYYGEKSCRRSRIIADGYEAEDFFPEMGDSGYWMYFTAAPLRGHDGSVIGAIETLQNVTERNQARADLERHHRHLEELVAHRTHELLAANEELSQYAYVVSHDLKAPLRAIRNYADFLAEDLSGTLAAEQEGYLQGLKKALRQGEQIVDDLLEYSRITRSDTRNQWFQPTAVIDELLAILPMDSNVEINHQNDWPTLYGDPFLLTQILQNLIANGIKFNCSEKKQINMGWISNGNGTIEIWLRDNGIGIAAHHQQQIFRVFQRLHTSSEYAGTGIGLAIVKKAALHMGWDIRIESAPGQGSTFYLKVAADGHRFEVGKVD
ncbi:PAS-domain containing protein [Sedimenticola sp.]|uniref:PAS-domain containing protein n=1 Tax=Sedimenticola sp. TaxID=1940285 RepID=UPI003D0A7FCF